MISVLLYQLCCALLTCCPEPATELNRTDQNSPLSVFQASVAHPVVLTEAPCNPLHCRQMMSELLFECYGVPHVSYGVDSLYSFFRSDAQRGEQPPQTGVILSSGYSCSHVLPVVNGR